MQNVDDEILDKETVNAIDKALLEFEEEEAKGNVKWYTREEARKLIHASEEAGCLV